MITSICKTGFLAAIVTSLISTSAIASDLDDGISSYTDDSIRKYDALGDTMVNRRFITLKAKSKANQAKNRKGCKELEGYDNVSNSVVIGAGEAKNLREVYNIHEGGGKSTAIGCQ